LYFSWKIQIYEIYLCISQIYEKVFVGQYWVIWNKYN
jgi:hypothetical protein